MRNALNLQNTSVFALGVALEQESWYNEGDGGRYEREKLYAVNP